MPFLPTMPESSASPRSFYRWPIRILGVLIIGVLVFRYSAYENRPRQQNEPVLPKVSNLPPFSLTERSGKTITNRDLSGKIWVADFVYTTCPGPCPMITANMAKLQKELANDPNVQLVSFTVDPQNDTPAALAAYATKFGADPNRWWFLTGLQKPLYDLIQNGFYQAVEDNRGKQPQEGQFLVTHSIYFVLVDRNGYVRNSYNALTEQGHDDLLKGIKTLEQEEPQ